MAKRPKFYVVWQGHAPGVYDNWPECQRQIHGFPGAQYKSFPSRQAATEAFAGQYEQYVSPGQGKSRKKTPSSLSLEELESAGVLLPSISVDAACSGNPGVLEYQGVLTDGGEPIFHEGPFPDGTVNIGEFLAIVDALRYLQEQGLDWPLYSDSKVAIGWVKKGRANTKLEPTSQNRPLFQRLDQAAGWLAQHHDATNIYKWQTGRWGEIPADFGRK